MSKLKNLIGLKYPMKLVKEDGETVISDTYFKIITDVKELTNMAACVISLDNSETYIMIGYTEANRILEKVK